MKKKNKLKKIERNVKRKVFMLGFLHTLGFGFWGNAVYITAKHAWDAPHIELVIIVFIFMVLLVDIQLILLRRTINT